MNNPTQDGRGDGDQQALLSGDGFFDALKSSGGSGSESALQKNAASEMVMESSDAQKQQRQQRPNYKSISNFVKSVRGDLRALKDSQEDEAVRSNARLRLNYVFGALALISLSLLATLSGTVYYETTYQPRAKQRKIDKLIKEHAEAAKERVARCRGIDWEAACDAMGGAAGARRHRRDTASATATADTFDDEFEQQFLDSDDPKVEYDNNCLRIYRLDLDGTITFPYHSNQLLLKGGNHTMALFIQHGALRNAQDYMCSFRKLINRQTYRDPSEILVVAPNFNYQEDDLVHPRDAFWNSTKPWGDWRVGAESDPDCCGASGRTISSFSVLDHMLGMLTNRHLYPNMNKISYVGHSAGGQMVQRYAIMSTLAALWTYEEEVDLKFIIANPSSYTYLDPRRYEYSCGSCECTAQNCTCDGQCTPPPPYSKLSKPRASSAGKSHPCHVWNYDRWPYGLGSFSDPKGYDIPYALRDGFLGVERAYRVYKYLDVVYMVGQNDTCNDGLPVCDASCWKRDVYEEGEWPCFRNQMDTRCPAMLQGPCRRTRGHQYMRYLEEMYGQKTHALHTVRGAGHNATAMFTSEIGMRELFE